MTFLHLQSSSISKPSSSLFIFTLSCSFKKPRISKNPKTIPARDRVIDFGKHRGKMLGSLPSSYLRWVSKKLRAGNFEEWAKLADQVLEDNIYRDRIEWEFAESVLTGNGGNNMAATGKNESAVTQLLELSERFSWDNEDKVGWSKIDFELLGTSKGGRIPRILDVNNGGKVKKEKEMDRGKKQELSETEERRKRRMRMKEKKMRIRDNNRDKFENGNNDGGVKSQKTGEDLNKGIHNPFPGREAFLKKVLSSKRFL